MDYRLVFEEVLSEDDITGSIVTSGSVDLHPNRGNSFHYSVPELEWEAIMENAEQQHFSFPIMLVTELDTRPTQLLLSRLHNTNFNIKIPVPSELRDRKDSTFAVGWPVKVLHRRSAQGTLVLKICTAFKPPTVLTLPLISESFIKKVPLHSCVMDYPDYIIPIPLTELELAEMCEDKPNYLDMESGPIVIQLCKEGNDAELAEGGLGSFCIRRTEDRWLSSRSDLRSMNQQTSRFPFLLELFLNSHFSLHGLYDAGTLYNSKYLTLTSYWIHGVIGLKIKLSEN